MGRRLKLRNGQIFCDAFYENREKVVREQIGKHLDGIKKNISQLYSLCLSRLMNAQPQKELTLDEFLSLESGQRQGILSAVLYNDALWRLEAAYLMLCIGMLNVAYSNLRSCLEILVDAHIIENLDSEAIKFLKGEEIEPTKISSFILEEYNTNIAQMKKTLGNWGVHSSLSSVQLGIFCGPNTFDKLVAQTNTKRIQTVHQSFADAAKTCIQAINDVWLIFFYLISKGTKYRRV